MYHKHFRAFLLVEMLCSLVLFSLLFLFTDTDPIAPVSFQLATVFCLFMSIMILMLFFAVVPLKIAESIYASILWMIPALGFAFYICKINKFEVMTSFNETSDLFMFVVKLSLFHISSTILLGLVSSPVFKKMGIK